jgi:hypothetical protein
VATTEWDVANAKPNNDNSGRVRDLAGTILSACFTLLGILVGVFGIVIGEFVAAGSWEDDRAEIAPFVIFIALLVAFDCFVCILALLNVADYVRSPRLLLAAAGLMLAAIGAFVGARTVQMLFT